MSDFGLARNNPEATLQDPNLTPPDQVEWRFKDFLTAIKSIVSDDDERNEVVALLNELQDEMVDIVETYSDGAILVGIVRSIGRGRYIFF